MDAFIQIVQHPGSMDAILENLDVERRRVFSK
jgi:hypothetical protein